MKKKLIPMILAVLCMAFTVAAQDRTPDGRVQMRDVSVTHTSGKINVSMKLDANKKNLRRSQAIVVTPVIEAGNHHRELPSVVFSGRHRMRADRRAVRFHTRTLPYDPAVALAPGVQSYNARVNWEPWMAGARLTLKEKVYACAGKNVFTGSRALASIPDDVVKPAVKAAVTYITPPAEAVKSRNMSGSAYLNFPVNQTVILNNFRDNARELSKITNTIDELKNDKDVTVNSISLKGYASPEGSYANNDRLSRGRSAALRDYLQSKYHFQAGLFNVSSVAEDWEGLRSLVEKSSLAGRQSILNVIAGSANPDAKERQLKALPAYRELLNNYFPQLRRVEYRIDYTARAFSVEEGRQKIKTNPGQLSLNEMFLVANSYPKGSSDFNNVFDIAARLYPNDPVANINQAAVLLDKGDAKGAQRFLDKFASNPAAWNNLGVMYMLQGDYTKARSFLEKATATPEVKQNLDLLKRLIK